MTVTTARSKQGARYRVTGNVERVFSKFISQGKLTVRFTQPQHDICLAGEPKQLAMIAEIVSGGGSPATGSQALKSATPAGVATLSRVAIPKTKMCISSRADYPVTTRFPDTLTQLKVELSSLCRLTNR